MSQEQKKKSKAKTTIINTVVLIAVLAGLWWVIKAYLKIGTDNYTNSAQVEAFVNPINTRVSAYIKEIRFVEHQQVKAGDTLIVLDDREIQTQLGQAEAAYKSALANRAATENSVRTAANNINTADANIDAAKARLWNMEQNYKRYEQLLKEEAVTGQQYDQIKAEYEAAKAQYEAMVNTKGTTALTVAEVKSRLAMNDAEIQRTENALNMARLNLSYCYILAPHDGVMGRRAVNEGQLLTMPGQQVATIVDSRTKWVSANFREKQMSHIAVGKNVQIKVDALDGKAYEGVIAAVSGATGARYAAIPVDNSTGNFVKVQQRIPIRIEFTDDNTPEALEALRTGMNVEVYVNK